MFKVPFRASTPHQFQAFRLARFLVLASGTWAFMFVGAQADEIALQSSIDSVTVFPRGAEVTRKTLMTVPKGNHILVLKDLPASLAANSIRVEGQVKGELVISSVDSRKIFVDPGKEDADTASAREKLEDRLEKLLDERRGLDDRINTAKTQKRFVEGLAGRPPFRPRKSRAIPEPPKNGNAPLRAEELSQIFFLIGTSLEKANETIRTTEIARRELNKEIKKVRNHLAAQPKKQERRTEVKVHVSAAQDVSGVLAVRYQVSNAWWQPFYDARLTTGADGKDAALEMVHRASISQRTGEAWDNVALKLSTTRPGQGTSAPELRPVKVSIKRPPAPRPVAFPRAMKQKTRGRQEPEQSIDQDQAQGQGGMFSGGAVADAIAVATERKATAPTEIARRELNKEIKKVRNHLAAQPKKQERRTEVKVHVSAAQDVSGVLAVRYQVSNAWWQPFYDARLTTGADGKDAALEMVHRASISQRTGEAWDNVALKLSTTRPGQGTSAPELRPVKVSIKRPPAPRPVAFPRAMKQKTRGRQEPEQSIDQDQAQGQGGMFSGGAVADAIAVATERKAELSAKPYQAVFTIVGRASVPQTGDPKKLQISSESVKPELMIRATPKLSATAWLYTKFTPTGAAGLLPGEVVLYRDGTFVGTGRVPLVPAGESLELGFGIDDAVKITRKEIDRSKGETGLITTSKLEERRVKISVTNRHKQAVRITVFDQVPYSEDEIIKVEIANGTTTPTQENYEDKRGILAWELDMKPGETEDITLAYRITWPRDKEITTSRR